MSKGKSIEMSIDLSCPYEAEKIMKKERAKKKAGWQSLKHNQ